MSIYETTLKSLEKFPSSTNALEQLEEKYGHCRAEVKEMETEVSPTTQLLLYVASFAPRSLSSEDHDDFLTYVGQLVGMFAVEYVGEALGREYVPPSNGIGMHADAAIDLLLKQLLQGNLPDA